MTPREETQAALRRCAGFLQTFYPGGGVAGIASLDGSERYGESLDHVLTPGQIWIQPPGTPTVGEAFLRAHRITHDPFYLRAARDVGRALASTQQNAGGWRRADTPGKLKEDGHASCTFDDDTSTAALRFLVHLSGGVLEPWLRKSIGLGLFFMLSSQFKNGAWPQGFPLQGDYRDRCTFNDSVINNCIVTLLYVYGYYDYPFILRSALAGGDFIIASQLPEPQAGWAQQYDQNMTPAWGRDFEPPGACSLVTARNIQTLIRLYRYTGDDCWLAPIPAAIEWLKKAKLESGEWSRLYALGSVSNQPIYGNVDRKVHCDIAEARGGYKWIGMFGVPAAIKEYENLESPSAAPAIIGDQDEQGRWVGDDGMIYIEAFVDNLNELCAFLEEADAF